MKKKYRVIKAYKSESKDPIILKKGENVIIGREYTEDPDWPGWIECTNKKGKKGWVPKQYLRISGCAGHALFGYSTNELNVKIGDEITVYEFVNGWAWSKNSMGEYGWIPIKNIKI